ncbi:DUF3267 domain-containing protein [Robertmurraya korlensis]|uniref:DUF3267 domain-containing protein n=1 Tax=Robertmurraya korlensis TaxID=519977 RepID=UPI0020410CC5|nr:DUF3267 domain-containing protein [Robertmurraya korlensis]MCM3600815.1 DUF3267 domain-containing protein [Robertmurraya korlensis]
MKISRKYPTFDENVERELLSKSWMALREPKNVWSSILLSLPFMFLAGWVTFTIVNLFSPLTLKEFGISDNGVEITFNLFYVVVLWLLVVIHEILHLVFIPNFLRSKKTYIGLSWFGGFVITEEHMSKIRFIIISIAPYIFLSILLPLVLGWLGLLSTTIKILVLLNSLASSVDMLVLFLILLQVPNNAVLVNCGPRTYWKL